MAIMLGWIIGCFIATIIGSNRKIGGVATFFISLIFSPLIGFIVALASPSLATIEFQRRTIQALAQQQQSPAQRIDFELNRLIQLLNEGKITESEYASLRNKVINSGGHDLPPAPYQQHQSEPAKMNSFDRFMTSWWLWAIIIGIMVAYMAIILSTV